MDKVPDVSVQTVGGLARLRRTVNHSLKSFKGTRNGIYSHSEVLAAVGLQVHDCMLIRCLVDFGHLFENVVLLLAPQDGRLLSLVGLSTSQT